MNFVSKATAFPATVQPGHPSIRRTPEGWARIPMGRLLKEVRRPVRMVDEQVYDLVTVKRARGGIVRREHLTGKEISVKSQFRIERGDFLISKRQIVHGACALVPSQFAGSIVSNEYAVLQPDDNLDNQFLAYLSHTPYFQQTCFHSSIGVHIEKMIFKLDRWFRWEFNIPPLAEQKRIAEILSTWDAAIETTERLLANAEAQKRALMQQLLKGKRRLNGYVSNDWRESLLVDAFDFVNGRAFKPSDWGVSGLPIVRIQNLTKSTDTLNRFSGHVEDKHLVRYGDFLLSWSATLETFIWKDEDAVLNQHIFKVVPRTDIDRNFGFYLISFEIDNLRSKVHGTGMKHITKKSLSKISARLPPYREQVEISDVLNIAANIEEDYRLELAKLICEKKGLTQQLLTGKRRVTM
ncbi:restriction endonuclease subunit S [Mesorhizobium sp. M0136]|uniref:restriction endonuclease subunit S n=1 Tax=Mesorhizobium sp. M0136 TaxID=2956890 RepID=UPI00333AA9AE